jgi:hypothetical protein
MLALVRQPDGTLKRQGPQIETTNPGTIDLVVRFIREKFEQEGWAKDAHVTIGVGPADGLDFSESPESMAAGFDRCEPIMGAKDTTDLVVKLANDVLDRIGDEYPNLRLGFYVYSAHADYPARYRPNPRISPIFAPIGYSRLHSTTDPRSKTRAFYRSVVEQWAELAKAQGNPLMVYEYNWNLADDLLPFTRIRTISEDLRYYHDLGFFGITIESRRAWTTTAAHNYVFARTAWDTSLEWTDLLKDFCRASYGVAANEMETYFLRLADVQQKAGMEAGSYFSAPLIFDDAYLAAAKKNLETAQTHTGLTEEEKERIATVTYGFRSLELYLEWHRAMCRFAFPAANDFGNELQANYDQAARSNPHYVARSAGIYIQRLLMETTRESLKYASEPYRIVEPVPDLLPTLLDPSSQGERLNIFGTEINDSQWIRTRTFGSTWDAQGLGLCREGAVWYRHRFRLPAGENNEGIGLLLGAFEDEARVWINGHYAGSSGIRYPKPAVFDLTDYVRPGEENILTIQIRRNSMANELGLGGILRPGYVFSGPRVQAAAKDGGEDVRVLPGGDTEKRSK